MGGQVTIDYELANLIVDIIVAVGSLAVAALAIWGQWFRDKLASPKLAISLHEDRGNITSRLGGPPVIYYHLKVKNSRRWAPASRVRVLCTRLLKRRPDGSFTLERLTVPVQLTWPFPKYTESVRNVVSEEVCDFGYVNKGDNRFWLSPHVTPNNFAGYVCAGEAMRVGLIASADNFVSKEPTFFEIAWDGQWTDNLEEMRNHLVIAEVNVE